MGTVLTTDLNLSLVATYPQGDAALKQLPFPAALSQNTTGHEDDVVLGPPDDRWYAFNTGTVEFNGQSLLGIKRAVLGSLPSRCAVLGVEALSIACRRCCEAAVTRT